MAVGENTPRIVEYFVTWHMVKWLFRRLVLASGGPVWFFLQSETVVQTKRRHFKVFTWQNSNEFLEPSWQPWSGVLRPPLWTRRRLWGRGCVILGWICAAQELALASGTNYQTTANLFDKFPETNLESCYVVLSFESVDESLTIQMKVPSSTFLSGCWCRAQGENYQLSLWVKSFSVAIHITTTPQYFPAVYAVNEQYFVLVNFASQS